MIIYRKIYYLLFVIIIVSCTEKKIELVSTTKEKVWIVQENTITSSSADKVDVVIDRAKVLQTIDGFGACFNELGWLALSKLKEEDRESIFNELFTPGKGANFSICRMPLGANDFSRDWYSYNETEGDFEMKSFSINNDLETLIPYIKEAKAYNPNLKLWASPWCPPSWMKWNKHYACATPDDYLAEKYRNGLSFEKQGSEGTNMFIQEEAYFKAYTLYFLKFIQEYSKQGIDISMVMPQNEFNSCQVFPSCTWTAKGLARFIGDYLGPEMEKQNVDIMFGTMERPNKLLVDTILKHETAGKYIQGVGFQWAGKDAIPEIHKQNPNLKLYQTEQECGDGKNDWKHCLHSWELMKHYISNGTSGYMYWNIALEQGGVSRWGWSQNSLVTVNANDQTFNYNYEYYLMKHLSHFVKSGAKLLKPSGSNRNLLAFENLDRSLIIVVQNEEPTASKFVFKADEEVISVRLKADSFTTIVVR